MDSISIGWKRQAADRINFGTKNEHADHRSVRKVLPKKQQQTIKAVETTRRGPILPIKRFSNSHSYATLSANTSATDVHVYHHRRLCSVRAAIMTFIIVVIIILMTAICLGIVFGVLKSQNSSGNDGSNLNSLSTPAGASYTSSISIGNQIGLPCSGYTEINDPTRNSSNAANILRCDNGPLFNTTNGGSWIRFVGTGGTKLALSAPNINHCGAFLPIWYNNTLSIPANTVVNDIACVVNYVDTCSVVIDISVVLCSPGSYYVFFLPAIPFCSARYCTE
ncbi:unnamed protein product [Adineta ricciae]|uniref:Uncharacterized protein n=1 Tax=Adineta ricciae TaxID=249248 RepID=A0A816E938_ADIRI|nr:unnamed protein product [Adineta ricciae]CAF1644601.1 unnamed protein product [Adineta ricciae]